MTDTDVWVIKLGQFEARVDVDQIGQMPVYNVRKLLKLARIADNLDSLESFGPLLEKAIRKTRTSRDCARLNKIKAIYEKEFMNYVN